MFWPWSFWASAALLALATSLPLPPASAWATSRSCNAFGRFNCCVLPLQRSCDASATLLQGSRTTFRPLQLLQDDISTCSAALGLKLSNNSPSIIAVSEKSSPTLDLNAWRSIWLCQRSIWLRWRSIWLCRRSLRFCRRSFWFQRRLHLGALALHLVPPALHLAPLALRLTSLALE